MANNDHLYQYDVPGFLFVDPLVVLVRATFSDSGATVTASTTRRQSHPGAAITGDTGDYDVTGLPTGRDYHIAGVHMVVADADEAVNKATVTAFDAAAGTLSFQVHTDATGAATDPDDGDSVHLTLLVDQGPA